MKNTARAALASAALGVSLLTACGGGGDTQAYCDDIDGLQSAFDAVGEQDFEKMEELLGGLKDLGDNAPSEVKDEWNTLTEGLDALTEAMSGIDMEALQDDPEKAMEAMQEMGEKMEALDLDNDDLQAAGDAIAEHAKDECGVDLNNS